MKITEKQLDEMLKDESKEAWKEYESRFLKDDEE